MGTISPSYIFGVLVIDLEVSAMLLELGGESAKLLTRLLGVGVQNAGSGKRCPKHLFPKLRRGVRFIAMLCQALAYAIYYRCFQMANAGVEGLPASQLPPFRIAPECNTMMLTRPNTAQ